MKISVIIPTLNEEQYITDVINDLKRQTVKPYEIIIADGGSTDKTVSLLKKIKGITLLRTQKHQGRQRNIAVRKAKGDMLLFLDADTRLEPGFIKKSLSEMNKKKLDIAVPIYKPYKHIKNLYFHAFSYVSNGLVYLVKRINPYGGACGMFMKKRLFEKTHGFHEKRKIDDIPLVREAAKMGRYDILHTTARLSERRFKRYGIAKVSFNYFVLFFLLVLNKYHLADRIDYGYGEYHKHIK